MSDMKPIVCPSCGWRLKPKNISVSFVHHYHTLEKQPYAITFVLHCHFCGFVLKEIKKEGEEAIRLWEKLDQKISESAP
ncbi:MAG: hypothetical protein DRO40_07860 [Thermoprotei archaeon]|mgnify:CR=1 FL=1|nr:MAG: hypothetical protein DRO40_07860 [Thermoprotei archaeon]